MRTLSVHSYKGGTGKTTFLLNLAGTLTSKESKVFAVDYDLRAPSFQSYFQLIGENYISDYISGERSVKQIKTPCTEASKGKLDLSFSSMEFLKQHSKQRDKLSRDDSKFLSKMYELQQEVSEQYDFLLLDTTPGFFFRSIDAMMISDVILTVAVPSTSNVLGLKELCSNIYAMLKEDTKMVLLINMVEEIGTEADKVLVEKNLRRTKRAIGESFYEGRVIEIPYYGVMGERIHSFEDEPNKEFLKKIEEIINASV